MSDTQSQQPNPNLQNLIKKARDIYGKLKVDLEPLQNGKYIAIEVNSGEHFIGETREQAVAKAKKKFPGIVVFVRRIGELEKASRHFHSPYPSHYARLL